MGRILTSGAGGLSVLDTDTGEVQWELRPQEHEALSRNERGWVGWYTGTTDEAKMAADGTTVLFTAVSGLVGLADTHRGSLTRLAWMPGAHSAEFLPGGACAVAVAAHPDFPPGAPHIDGNYLAVIELEPPFRERWREPLDSAHGVVWDPREEKLWALGGTELRAYEMDGLVPRRVQTVQLPGSGGHDLAPMPGEGLFSVTTSNAVVVFNSSTMTFSQHPMLHQTTLVKSVSTSRDTGRIVYVAAPQGEYQARWIG